MKTRILYSLLLTTFSLTRVLAQEQVVTKESFSPINLNYPGLEKTNKLFTAGKYEEAGKELLTYFRNRKASKNNTEANVNKTTQELADNALLHKFKPHKGYGFFDYGQDINWQYWPVKDNEVRWQLHRVYWWQPMGLVYRSTGDEKYAKEWIFQFRDWVKKNPLGLSADNDKYAWRPLEISERLSSLPGTFNLFITSPNFTPAFLLEFIKSYAQQTDHLIGHYATDGNHRLFEAQRALGAGCFFPEINTASTWRKSGATVLNIEIKKQIYPDGMQFELAPGYHNAMISTFLEGLRLAQQSGMENEFPETYKATIEKMILATINFSFPDYTFPMFGDAWLTEKASMLKQYKNWAKTFPDNPVIQYFASDRQTGEKPSYLSHPLSTAGFYTFRNGWDVNSTVMVLKASPPGEFHAQPDNGTFELWVNGRNFTPDAGCFVYSGDAEITKQRNWYRQSRVHSTLTLDNQNMVITKAQQNKWETGKNLDILTFTNPSYGDLNHQRSVLFINQKYFLIIDRAIGKATGNLDTHFQLKEDCNPVFDTAKKAVYSTYADGNNLLIQNLNTDEVKLVEEEGKVSYQYQKELKRPAFAFEKSKMDDKTQQFISVVYPYNGNKAPEISIKANVGNDYNQGKIDLNITVDGKKSEVKARLW